jgi:hypothetical protein
LVETAQGRQWRRTDQLTGAECLLLVEPQTNLLFATTIEYIEDIGEKPTIGLMTGTRTLIVEGYASHNSEYSHQRPSCEYFIGIAQGRGITVTIPPDCELLKTDFLYGFQQEQLERWNARMAAREADLNNKVAQLDSQIAQATETRAQYRGALQDTQHLRKNWKGLISK